MSSPNQAKFQTVRYGHKRARSSLGSAPDGAPSTSAAAHSKKKTKPDEANEEPRKALVDIVNLIDDKLKDKLVEPQAQTAHLWNIHQMLNHLVQQRQETGPLHKGAWVFLGILTQTVGQPQDVRYQDFLDISRSYMPELQKHKNSSADFGAVLQMIESEVKALTHKRQLKARHKRSSAKKTQHREAAKEAALDAVGDTNLPLKTVLCLDIETGRPIQQQSLLAQGPWPGSPRDPNSIPEAAVSGEFEGFVSADKLKELGFKIYSHGTVYWFAKAPDGLYYFVLGAMWRNKEDLEKIGQDHLDSMVDFAERAVEVGYKVDKNKAQNMEGEMYMVGWHFNMSATTSVSTYALPQKIHNTTIDDYLDVNKDAKTFVDGVVYLQNKEFAPNIADYTMANLQQLGVPMLGETSIEFSKHEPGLGSNMSLSRHDKLGRNYGNGMHTDHDLDGHKLHLNKAFTTGAWWFGNRDGKAEANTRRIQEAFTPAYLLFPAYRVALDLNSHSFLLSNWRGGMDEHGTTPSKVNLESGLTRWGCSVQSNWGLPARLKSETTDKHDKDGNLLPKPTRKGPEEIAAIARERMEEKKLKTKKKQ